MLVILGCANQKARTICKAEQMYVGNYWKHTLLYARSLVADKDIRILSAKHGLLTLDTMIAPYNLRLGSAGSIRGPILRAQAASQNLLHALRVIVVAGEDYLSLARYVWPRAERALPRKTMGHQIRYMQTRYLNTSASHTEKTNAMDD